MCVCVSVMKLKAQLSPQGVLLLQRRFLPALERLATSSSSSTTAYTQVNGAGVITSNVVQSATQRAMKTVMTPLNASLYATTSHAVILVVHKDKLQFCIGDASASSPGVDVLLRVPSQLVFERATIEGVGEENGSVALRVSTRALLRALRALDAAAAEEILLKLGVRPLVLMTDRTNVHARGGVHGGSHDRRRDRVNATMKKYRFDENENHHHDDDDDGHASHRADEDPQQPYQDEQYQQAFLSFTSRSVGDLRVVQNVPVVRIDDAVDEVNQKSEGVLAERGAVYLRMRSGSTLAKLGAVLERFRAIADLVEVGIDDSGELKLRAGNTGVMLSARFRELDARWSEGQAATPGSVNGGSAAQNGDIVVPLRALLRVLNARSTEPEVLLLGVPPHMQYLHLIFIYDAAGGGDHFNMAVRIPTVADDI